MKPLASIDVETTGTNTATDAIVSLAIHVGYGDEYSREWKFKPWKPIPPEVEQLIGISNAQVANLPPFKADAFEIHNALSKCDICGFNVRAFDVAIIWEEFYRCGIEWDLSDTLIIDAGTIFKLREERTLTAALKFYCGIETYEGAHGALSDARSTADVLEAQLKRYPDLGKMDRAALAKASEYDGPKRLTFDGKIIEGPDGAPIFNFGKYRDKQVKVTDDLRYAEWMLSADFPAQTKLVLRKIIEELEQVTLL